MKSKSQLGSITVKSKNNKITQTKKRSDAELGLTLLAHIEGQLNRADSKAQFTLTANTLLIASATLLNNGVAATVLDYSAPLLSRVAGVSAVLMFIALLFSTFYSLLAVMPKLTLPAKDRNVFFFGAILRTDEKTFIERIRKTEAKEFDDMVLSETYALAGIAQQKFLHIKRSHHFLLVAMALWAVMQLLIMIQK
jgi:hypothetical protein